MKKHKVLIKILIIIIILFIQINVEAETNNDKIHFMSVKSSDAIIIESNGHYGLIDSSNPSDPNDAYYTVDANGIAVKNYLTNILGNNKLDFIILTHSHSDHIGGIPDITNFVNNDTIVFYKLYQYITPEEEINHWNNEYYYVKALEKLETKNAYLFEISENNLTDQVNEAKNKNANITNLNYKNGNFQSYTTNIDDTIYFKFGDFEINLYSLYNLSETSENLNSIITLVKKDSQKILLVGDIETKLSDKSGNPTLGVENQVADIVGDITVLKAGHHGYSSSNSLYMVKKLKPENIILTNSSTHPNININVIYNYLKNNESNFYATGDASGAVVADIYTNKVEIDNYNTSGNKIASATKYTPPANTGWISVNNTSDKDKAWMYINSNNQPVKGINNLEYGGRTATYFFDSNGIMQTGFIKSNGNTYYLSEKSNEDNSLIKGEMLFGWQTINNKTYYFCKEDNEIDNCQKGAMLTGWNNIKYNNKEYQFYFADETQSSNYKEGEMITGRHQIVKDEKKSYFYFAESNDNPEGYIKGAMISNITYNNHTYDNEGREVVPDNKPQDENQEYVEIPNTFKRREILISIIGIICLISGAGIIIYNKKINIQ